MIAATIQARAESHRGFTNSPILIRSDVKRAAESVESVKAAAAALDGQLAEDIAAVTAKLDQNVELERIPLAPKRGQVEVQFVALAWVPDSRSRA